MKLFTLISLLVLLIYSCQSSEKRQQTERLLIMIEQTDSLNRLLEQNKIDSVVEYQLAANSFMLRLKNEYKPTMVDMGFGRKVEEFKELQMLFVKEREENKRTLSDEASVIISSISEEKKTLNILRKDIENGRGNKEKYHEFIRFEQDKLNTIEVLLDHYLIKKKKYLPRFRKSLKELNAFMDKWGKENMPKKN